MLTQNLRGVITFILIIALVVALYAGYKVVIEPRFITNQEAGIFVTETDNTVVSPEIEIYTDNANIMWETPYTSIGGVIYSTNPENCISKNAECTTINSEGEQKHNVMLTNLIPNTEYFYKIKIDDTYYPIEESNFFSFTTQQQDQTGKTVQVELGGQLKLEDFQKAIQEQDLTYDINKDGKVNLADVAAYKKQNSQ